MANALNEDLTGRVVVLSTEWMEAKSAPAERRCFRVDDGFGARSFTAGNAIFGEFLYDGERCRMEGYMVERFATDGEIEAANAIREAGV